MNKEVSGENTLELIKKLNKQIVDSNFKLTVRDKHTLILNSYSDVQIEIKLYS